MSEHKPCPLCGEQMSLDGFTLWSSCGLTYSHECDTKDELWALWDNGQQKKARDWFYKERVPELDAQAVKNYAEHQEMKQRGW